MSAFAPASGGADDAAGPRRDGVLHLAFGGVRETVVDVVNARSWAWSARDPRTRTRRGRRRVVAGIRFVGGRRRLLRVRVLLRGVLMVVLIVRRNMLLVVVVVRLLLATATPISMFLAPQRRVSLHVTDFSEKRDRTLISST